jgi:tRNA pseudouridine55 synthase
MPAPDGLLVVDKPAGWTSHDVVGRARRLCATRKVGHAGTLDPMATGVLVLGIGRATRLLTFLVGCDKDYTATIRLGQTTVTDDAEGEVTASVPAGHLTDEQLAAAVAALTGAIQQVPSSVSAIKVKGERAYHRVRAGEDVELAARPVTVSRFEVLATREGDVDGIPVLDVDVEVTVSSGTYVRALARDLGASLGVGGHLLALRRTRVGAFTLDGAHDLTELGELLEAQGADAMPVTPLADAARAQFAVRELTPEETTAVGYGQRPESAQPGRTEPVAAFAPDGRLVAMLDESGPKARAHVVFAPAGS